jgi:hypothetical protein
MRDTTKRLLWFGAIWALSVGMLALAAFAIRMALR